jgi:hypothetical protein
VSRAPQAVALVALAATGCAGWGETRTAPLLEAGFGAGVRVPARMEDRPLVSVSGTAGAVRWWRRGAEGPARHSVGLGGVVTVTWFDLERTDFGAELIVAPPRRDRRTGFQFRVGGRGSTDGAHGMAVFSAEWSDTYVGALFAEAAYDFPGEESAFLFGARVNLFWPVTLVRAEAFPMD